MSQKNNSALLKRAQKYIDDAEVLLSNENTPFNTMWRYFKSMQSMWLRLIDESVENSSSRLEDMCVDLELTIEKVQKWINEHAPASDTTKTENADEKEDVE
jgi:hypothetical protein